MSKLFNLSQFDFYKEDNRREVKKANGGLPNDMWEPIRPMQIPMVVSLSLV